MYRSSTLYATLLYSNTCVDVYYLFPPTMAWTCVQQWKLCTCARLQNFFISSLTKGCPYFPEQTEPERNTHSKYGMNTLALIISASTEPQTYTNQCLLSIQLCAVSSRHLFSLYHVGNSTKLLRGEQHLHKYSFHWHLLQNISTHLHALSHKISNILLKAKIKQNIILSSLHTLTSHSCIWVVRMTADGRASGAVSEVSLSAGALNLIKIHCASTRASTKVWVRESYCICWSKHIVSFAISKDKYYLEWLST